jgi:hypothetical protein
VRTACPAHLIVKELIRLITFLQDYKFLIMQLPSMYFFNLSFTQNDSALGGYLIQVLEREISGSQAASKKMAVFRVVARVVW